MVVWVSFNLGGRGSELWEMVGDVRGMDGWEDNSKVLLAGLVGRLAETTTSWATTLGMWSFGRPDFDFQFP